MFLSFFLFRQVFLQGLYHYSMIYMMVYFADYFFFFQVWIITFIGPNFKVLTAAAAAAALMLLLLLPPQPPQPLLLPLLLLLLRLLPRPPPLLLLLLLLASPPPPPPCNRTDFQAGCSDRPDDGLAALLDSTTDFKAHYFALLDDGLPGWLLCSARRRTSNSAALLAQLRTSIPIASLGSITLTVGKILCFLSKFHLLSSPHSQASFFKLIQTFKEINPQGK
jgi:hypothetical protein